MSLVSATFKGLTINKVMKQYCYLLFYKIFDWRGCEISENIASKYNMDHQMGA